MERKLKDSGIPWIGQIPEHWEKIRCGLLFTCIGSGTTPTAGAEEYYSNGTVHWLQTGDLNDGVIKETSKKITDFAVASKSLKVYPQGSVVIAMYGATIAKLGLLDINTTVNQACCVLEKSEKIISLYAFYFFYAAKTWLISLASGGGQPNISQAIISNFNVIVPPLSEQEAIAAHLDKKCGEIDELIEVEQQMISDLEAYRQAVITEAVTHGLNPNAPLRDSGIEWLTSLPEHWKVVRFKSKFSMRKGLIITKADLVEAGVPVINYGQIHSKYNSGTSIVPEILKYVPVTYLKTEPESIVQEGDFIFADTSEDKEGCGNCAYIDSSGDMFAGYHSIIASGGKRNKFFAYLFLTDAWRSQIRSQVTGIKVYSISQSMLANTELIIPPLSEQQGIVDYLDAQCAEIDDLIKVKQEKIETLKQYRQSLIFEAVTGKTNID